MEIKPCAFSHSWYPGSAGECEQAIQSFIDQNLGMERDSLPRSCAGGIVPHAGWVYSGRIACGVIQALSSASVDTILLFGAHMRPSDSGFILGSGGVDTPLGHMETDLELAQRLAGIEGVRALSPDQFPDENTLELQYPFIRYFFPKAKLVAAGVPPSDLAQEMGIAAVAAAKDLGREIKVIGSTDMTHYGPNFGFEPRGRGEAAVDWVAQENDAAAIQAMENMDPSLIISQGLTNHNLCCSGAVAAAAAACKKMGAAKGITLDYASSFDVSKSDSFVGYCGMLYPFA